jgi:hypothetical protein
MNFRLRISVDLRSKFYLVILSIALIIDPNVYLVHECLFRHEERTLRCGSDVLSLQRDICIAIGAQ